MRYLAILLLVSRTHFILTLLTLLVLTILSRLVFVPPKIRDHGWKLIVMLFWVCIGNLFFGNFLINPIVEHYGKPGMAIIVKTSETANLHNDQRVMRNDVMIKPKDAPAVATYFLTSDFNVVNSGSWNSCIYPWPGVKFNVRFLPEYPRAFVIIANDDSEYGKTLRGQALASEINSLKYQLKLEPQNSKVKTKLEVLMRKQKMNNQ